MVDAEIGAHVRNILCYLISFGHSLRSRALTNRILFFEKTYASATSSKLLFIKSTMVFVVCVKERESTKEREDK